MEVRGDECVEVALQEGTLLLRESDDSGRILPVTPQGPAALLGRLRVGRDG
ncbi:DUF397 domain-containing protein [Streptomyces sp. NBC_00659]